MVRWKLSVRDLSGSVRRADLRTSGTVFTLCRRCRARSHGTLVLLGAMWRRILMGGGRIAVRTREHPRGELRGSLRHG